MMPNGYPQYPQHPQHPQHPHHASYAQPNIPKPKSNLGLILGIVGGVFVLFVILAGIGIYVVREKKHERQANAWSFDIDALGGDSITVDVHGTPFDAKVTVQGGQTTECSILCHVTLERKDLKPGEKKITVALDWKGRHVEKSKERALYPPKVTFEGSSLEKRARQCELTTNEPAPTTPTPTEIGRAAAYKFHYVVGTDDGVKFSTKGGPGDTVSVNREPAVTPGTAGHTHALTNASLLKLLTLGTDSREGGVRQMSIKIPIDVKSSDGIGWTGELSCAGDLLRYYIEKELKASRLGEAATATGASSPKAGVLVLGGDLFSMFYVGEGDKPLDAKLVAIMSRNEILSKDCTYGSDWDHKFYFYHWYAHDADVVELRAPQPAPSRAKRRFAPTMTGFVCPTIARFSVGESSRSEDISPKPADEAAWLRTLL